MLIPFTQSCLNDYDDDIYDIQAEMPFNAALATVVTPSEVPGEAVIESDNDGIAYVVNPDKLTRFETNNPGQRIGLLGALRLRQRADPRDEGRHAGRQEHHYVEDDPGHRPRQRQAGL